MFTKNAVKCLEKYGDFSKLWKGEGLAEALQAAHALQQKGSSLSKDFARCILQGCLKKKDLRAGRQVHALILAHGLLSHDCLGSELIRVFAACNHPPAAFQVFHSLPFPSVYTCNSMMCAQVSFGNDEEALCLYNEMCTHGIEPDKITYLHAFKACANVGSIEKGRVVHGDVLRSECPYDPTVSSAIIDMYVKCCVLEDASKVFNNLPMRDAVSWGAVIAGHASFRGSSPQALHLFTRMQEESHKPNQVIFASVLTACANIGAIQQGRLIHNQIIVNNIYMDTKLGNNLVDMYVKCGSIDEASKVLHGLSAHDLVTWSSLLSGYAQQGDGFSALQIFDQLTEQGAKLDTVTYLCLLKPCTKIGAILLGMRIHEGTIRNGFDRDQLVGSALLDMYVKCGYLKEAFNVFKHLVDPDVVSWSTMLLGFAQAGDWSLTFSLLDRMQRGGMQPDAVTFTSILRACSQSGQSVESYEYFEFMKSKHWINPAKEHYSCLLNLLSRTGKLYDAEDLVNTIPVSHNLIQSTSMLTSCKTYSNLKLGKQCFEMNLKKATDNCPTSGSAEP